MVLTYLVHLTHIQSTVIQLTTWKTKMPVTKTLVVEMWLGVVFGIWPWQWYSTTSALPSLSLYICSSSVDIISSLAVNLGSTVSSSRCPVSLQHICLHTDTLKLVMWLLAISTDTYMPNWNAVLPWSPPTTTWTRTILGGYTNVLDRYSVNIYWYLLVDILLCPLDKFWLLFSVVGNVTAAVMNNAMTFW